MGADGGHGLQTSLDDFFSELDPPEDAGAQTASRYRYQAEVVARFVLGLRPRGQVLAVICEWFEDFIVVFRDDRTQLGSVKHRELSRGPFTVADLLDEGGLRHLFDRWTITGKRSDCLLCTNQGLTSDAQRLKDACGPQDRSSVEPIAAEIRQRLGAKDLDEACRFLSILTIEDGLPSRRHIEAANIQNGVRPLLRARGYGSYSAEKVYEAIVERVREHSEDREAETHDFVDIIADPTRLSGTAVRARKLEARIVRYRDLAEAIAAGRPDGRMPLPLATAIPQSTVLAKKLVAGGFGPSALEAAQRLRASWTAFEAEQADDLGPDPLIEDVRTRILREAAGAEGQAQMAVGQQASYGLAMHARLVEAVSVPDFLSSCAIPIDGALAEGCAYDLTDQCRIWWSPVFDLDVVA